MKEEEANKQPKESAAERQRRLAEEAKAYKKYLRDLEENVKRMRLETEEMELFIRAHHLKKELNEIQKAEAEASEQRRQEALKRAEQAEKKPKIIEAKQGKPRSKTDVSTEQRVPEGAEKK